MVILPTAATEEAVMFTDFGLRFPANQHCALYLSLISVDCVFSCVTTLWKVKENTLPSSCIYWGNMLPRSMLEKKGAQGVCFFHLTPPPPLTQLRPPALPRVSITVSLHLSLARAGHSFLMLMHTQIRSGAHI